MRDVREGRAEVVQMWGRPESVRREFRAAPLALGRVAEVVAVVPDLMLQSRVVEILSGAGHEVTALAPDAGSTPGRHAELYRRRRQRGRSGRRRGSGVPRCSASTSTPTLSRGPAPRRPASALVVPRSRMVRELPELAEKLLAG